MLHVRLPDFFHDAEPIPHGGNLAERHARLRHAERPRIHSKKDHSLARISILAQIRLMRCPRVFQRIINVRNRRRETQLAHSVAKAFCGLNQRMAHGNSVGLVPRIVFAGAMQLAQGALKTLNLAFVINLLPLREFESFEHFLHFIE